MSILEVSGRHRIPLATDPHTGVGVITGIIWHYLLQHSWCSEKGAGSLGCEGMGLSGKIIHQHTAGGGRRVNFLNTFKVVTGGSNDPHRAISIQDAESV